MNTLPVRLFLGALVALAPLGCAGSSPEPAKQAEE
jgi:hypothetical protein